MHDAAVIFDVDGVLLDLTPPEEDAFFHPFLELHGLSGLSRDWDSYRIRNDHDIMAEILERHFGRPPAADELDRLTRSYLSHLGAGLAGGKLTAVEIPGARELLSALRDDGVIVGIATANLVDAARLRLESAGLWEFVADLPFGADGGGAKARILSRAVAASGLPRHRIVYIGDNLNDVDAGLRNEVHFIGFAREKGRRERLAQAGAATVCGDHDTSYQLISGRLGGTKLRSGTR
ncbi:MAG: HAD family hydrolase [Rhizobiales bacterium]|nr:HAD family hydrolase [Hyphomicrobiales bacterium]